MMKPRVFTNLEGINVASGEKLVSVHLLTSEVLYFAVEKQCKVNELFSHLCRHIALAECVELFGLCMRQDQCRWASTPLLASVLHPSSARSYAASQVQAAVDCGQAELAAQRIFLEPVAKLSKYAPKQWKHARGGLDALSRPLLQLQFRVQFYVDSYLFLADRVARTHYYLQLRRNLLDYSLGALSTERAFLLASYALQADKGDHRIELQNSQSIIPFSNANDPPAYFEPSEYLPGWLLAQMGDEFVLRHLPSMHQDQRGVSSTDAQLMFIKEASEQAPHNMHMYRLFRQNSSNSAPNERIWLAVCPTGVQLFEQDRTSLLRVRLSTFAWADIGKLFFEKRKFEIRSIGYPIRKFTYCTCSEEMAKHLLWLCRVSHQFQLMIAPRLREMKRREVELSRKRYRESYIYSGEDAKDKSSNTQRRAISSHTMAKPPEQMATSVSMVHTAAERAAITQTSLNTPLPSTNSTSPCTRSAMNVDSHIPISLPTGRLSLESLTMSAISESSRSSGVSERPCSSETASNSVTNSSSANFASPTYNGATSTHCGDQLSSRSESAGSCSPDSAFISCEHAPKSKPSTPCTVARTASYSQDTKQRLHENVSPVTISSKSGTHSSSGGSLAGAVSCLTLNSVDGKGFAAPSGLLRPTGSLATLLPAANRVVVHNKNGQTASDLATFSSCANFSAMNNSKVVNGRRFGRLASASKSMPNVVAELSACPLRDQSNNVLQRAQGALSLHQHSPANGSSAQSVFSAKSADSATSNATENSLIRELVNESQTMVDCATSPLRQHIYENLPFHRPPVTPAVHTPSRVGTKIGVSSLTRGMQLASQPAYQIINGITAPRMNINSRKSAVTSLVGTSTSSTDSNTDAQSSVFHSEPSLISSVVTQKTVRALSDPSALGSQNTIHYYSQVPSSGHSNKSVIPVPTKVTRTTATSPAKKHRQPHRSPSSAADLAACRSNWNRNVLHASLCDLVQPMANKNAFYSNQSSAQLRLMQRAESSGSLMNSHNETQNKIRRAGSHTRMQQCNLVSSAIPNTLNGRLRQAESELQLSTSKNVSSMQIIPPPPDYASYMNKQQALLAASNPMLMNGRVKATSEQQLNRQTNPRFNGAMDLAGLKKRSQDLELPLITALFNDRSLMLPKTVPNRVRPHNAKFIDTKVSVFNNPSSLEQLNYVHVTPIDKPPATVQVLPLLSDNFNNKRSPTLDAEKVDRNHNTLNCNYNLAKTSRNPTAEYIEKLWAEHFSQ